MGTADRMADKILEETERAREAMRKIEAGGHPEELTTIVAQIKGFAADRIAEAGEDRLKLASLVAAYGMAQVEAALHCATEVGKVEMLQPGHVFGESDDEIAAYLRSRTALHAYRIISSQTEQAFRLIDSMLSAEAEMRRKERNQKSSG